MQATITADDGFTCSPNGYSTVNYPKGVVVEGDVARWAVNAGAATVAGAIEEDKPADAPKKPRGRRKKDLGAAPENKGVNNGGKDIFADADE